MRDHFVRGIGAALVLMLTATVCADIVPPPPPPPAGLSASMGYRPLTIVVAGLAASIAIALVGVAVVRSSGRSGVRAAVLLGIAAVLVTAGIAAFRAARAWAEYAALKTRYENTLAERRASRRWIDYRDYRPREERIPPAQPLHRTRLAVAVFALESQSSFPQTVPWAALMLSRTGGGNGSRPGED